MMKPLRCLLALGIVVAGCTNNQEKDQPVATGSLNARSIARTNTIDSAVTQQSEPAIVDLPFGPKSGANKNFCNETMFYLNIIGENYTAANGFKNLKPAYPLPPIDRYIYTVIDTVYDPGECAQDISMDSVFRVTSYKLRLPDHEGFEVYYMADDMANNNLTPGFTGRCANFELKFYGALIFYQKATKTARLLPVYHNYYNESQHERYFAIDKNYRITICNKIFSEGDYDSKNAVEMWDGPRYEVTMKKSGAFEIKRFGE
ncbi:hypothetical protein [Niastella populi]|uniref:Lipoprotein n=1 Tax=Niastella populi TaxID=550983 RepID=A0A1V9FDL4_9BACT|nr:hypothetical protein [Niastella populi]OQP56474.1 hypothetical protein A4R26_04765 [Niastella populi]